MDIPIHTSQLFLHRILYTKVNSNVSNIPIMTSCQTLLGSVIAVRSAVKYKLPHNLTIRQKSIVATIKTSKLSEKTCSGVFVLKYSFTLLFFIFLYKVKERFYCVHVLFVNFSVSGNVFNQVNECFALFRVGVRVRTFFFLFAYASLVNKRI